ncbi:hypothetical protein Dimus_009252 [Dionaea muscipula]
MATIRIPSSSSPALATLTMLAAILCTAVVDVLVSAQVPAPAPAPGSSLVSECFDVLTTAADCIDYLSPGSNLTDPGKACCKETHQLIKSIPHGGFCLCELLAHPELSPLPVDVSQAWKLSSRCGIPKSPSDLCRSLGVAVKAPPGLLSSTASPPGLVPTTSPPAQVLPTPVPAPGPSPPSHAAPPPSGATTTTTSRSVGQYLSLAIFFVGLISYFNPTI